MKTLVIRVPVQLAKDGGFSLIADLVGSVEGGPTDMSSAKKKHLKSTGYGKAKRAR